MKAVITAENDGRGLRPLTCTVPSFAVRLLGKPLIEHTIDLLLKNGVKGIVTAGSSLDEKLLKNLALHKNRKIEITVLNEEQNLGNAGLTKKAAMNFNETFIVVKGDFFIEAELENAVDFHKKSGADLTAVYTENQSSPFAFIAEPKCLSFIPENKRFDFEKDLIPFIKSRKMTANSYKTAGYCESISNSLSYRECQEYMLKNQSGEKCLAENIFVKGELPQGNYTLEPPVYIGENVTIGDNTVIGPFCVIDDGASIGENVKIESSVLLENTVVSSFSKLYKTVVCPGALIRKNSRVFENSVIGSGAVIGENCVVCDGVLVWPQKSSENNLTLKRNLRHGNGRREIFDDYGIGTDEKLDAEKCAAIGAAIGSAYCAKKVAVACDGNEMSKALMNCLLGGIAASGCQVWNFGDSFYSQLSFYTSFCSLPIGIFIECHADEIRIRLCSEGGLSLSENIENEIEQRFIQREFKFAQSKEIRSPADMTSVNMMYRRELLRQCETNLFGLSVMPAIENEKIAMLFEDCVNKLEGKIGNGVTVNISYDGARLSVIENNIDYPFHKILALLCMHEALNGNDIAVPFDAPQVIASVAGVYERKVLRFSDAPSDETDEIARTLARKQVWSRDGLFMAVRLLSLMKEQKSSLKELCTDLPDFYIENKVLNVNFPLSVLNDMFEVELKDRQYTKGGWLIRKNGVRTLIIPGRTGKKLRILSESFNSETAADMCEEITRKIESISLDNISK